MESTRRYDIDWLRVITIGLLLIYHIAIVFQPWGLMIGFIQNEESIPALWIPMSMLNVWRIPLLFFVSGMGFCFAMRKRSTIALLAERSKRILLPLLDGSVLVVPLHILMLQYYYELPLSFQPSTGHLWFLGHIFSYALLASPLVYWLKNHHENEFRKITQFVFSSPVGLVTVVAAFCLEAWLVNPSNFAIYFNSLHGYALGALAFFFGFTMVYSGEAVWNNLSNFRWFWTGFGLVLFGIRFYHFDLQAPNYLIAIESASWIFGMLGLAYRYLQKPGIWLATLSEAAYPVYIWHMAFLYLGAALLVPLALPAMVKFVLLLPFTIGGSLLMYFIIRKWRFTRYLFGLKVQQKEAVISIAEKNMQEALR